MKKKTGGGSDSTKVMPKEPKGMRKSSDLSTSYNKPKIHNTSKFPTGPKNATVMVSKSEIRKKK